MFQGWPDRNSSETERNNHATRQDQLKITIYITGGR